LDTGGLALVGCGDGALYVIDIREGKTLYALGAHKVKVYLTHGGCNAWGMTMLDSMGSENLGQKYLHCIVYWAYLEHG
jgi:hypothetical protein